MGSISYKKGFRKDRRINETIRGKTINDKAVL